MSDLREKRAAEETAAVDKVLASNDSFGEQVDAITEIRHYFSGTTRANALLASYLAGTTPLSSVLTQLADPIDAAYSSGHVDNSSDDPDGGKGSCESQLWNLWLAILHAARKTDFLSPEASSSSANTTPDLASSPQAPLLDLIDALHARPDPPAPKPLSRELQENWVWADGTLWSTLLLLAPSTRELWNDAPGPGAGGATSVERRAWANVNGFVAALWREERVEVGKYGVWALRDALEQDGGDSAGAEETKGASGEEVRDGRVRAAAAWVRVAGREMWGSALENEGEDEGDGEVVPVETAAKDLPFGAAVDYTRSRWRFWREKFGVLASKTALLAETRTVAGEMAALMSQIEQEPVE